MFGVLVGLACIAGVVVMMVKMYKSYTWHNQGVGERSARAEYARVQREQPDSAEARLSEAEFVQKYVAARPGFARYIIIALLLTFIGLPAACTMGLMSATH